LLEQRKMARKKQKSIIRRIYTTYLCLLNLSKKPH